MVLAVNVVESHLHTVGVRLRVHLRQKRDLFLHRLSGSDALYVEGAGRIRRGKGRARARIVGHGGHLDHGVFDRLVAAGVLEIHRQLKFLAAEHRLPAVIVAFENDNRLHLHGLLRGGGLAFRARRSGDVNESVRRFFRHLVGGNGDRNADVPRRHGSRADHRERHGSRRARRKRRYYLRVQFAVDRDLFERRQNDGDVAARCLAVVFDGNGEIKGIALAQILLVDGVILHHQPGLFFGRFGGSPLLDHAFGDRFLAIGTVALCTILPCNRKFQGSRRTARIGHVLLRNINGKNIIRVITHIFIA